jgi:hypothetical protein
MGAKELKVLLARFMTLLKIITTIPCCNIASEAEIS